MTLVVASPVAENRFPLFRAMLLVVAIAVAGQESRREFGLGALVLAAFAALAARAAIAPVAAGTTITAAASTVAVTTGAAASVGTAAGLIVTAPVAVLDAQTRDTYDDQVRAWGKSLQDNASSTGELLTTQSGVRY